MGLMIYMIITSIYWYIAIYYPIRVEPLRKRLLIRLFWLPVLIIVILMRLFGRGYEDEMVERNPEE